MSELRLKYWYLSLRRVRINLLNEFEVGERGFFVNHVVYSAGQTVRSESR